MWKQMGYCVRFLRQQPQYQNSEMSPPDLISRAFHNVLYIWMRRRDKIPQAMSDDIAIETGHYAWTGTHKPNVRSKPSFNYYRVEFLYHRILAAEDAWQQYFNSAGVTPFKVVYEEFIATYEAPLVLLLTTKRVLYWRITFLLRVN